MKGIAAEAQSTQPTPALEPLAEELRDLRELRIEVRWRYRRRPNFSAGRATIERSTVVVVDGGEARKGAVGHWLKADPARLRRPELAAIAEGAARADAEQ